MLVKGTFTEPQAQKGLPVMVPVVIVLADEVTDNVISSTANEGSEAFPSPSFFHTKPIFTFELLSADAGRAIEKAVHFPCPPPHVVVLASALIDDQDVPSKYTSDASSSNASPFSR